MDDTAQGLEIVHAGHRTRLKWHRLRRRMSDPLFGAEVMAEGFRLGASMELDLRVRGDGGFVVLHDEELEGETTGRGRIAAMSRADMAEARFRDGRKLVFSEDLAALLSRAHPDALLQFDMKDFLPQVGARGVAHLAELFADAPCPLIVSADDSDLIVAVRRAVPSLRRGIDPTNALVALAKADNWDGLEPALVAEIEGPAAPDTVYLHWQLVLGARARGIDLIGLCRARGMSVDAWTYTLADPAAGFSAREHEEFATLLALGADQITTDEAIATELAWRRSE